MQSVVSSKTEGRKEAVWPYQEVFDHYSGMRNHPHGPCPFLWLVRKTLHDHRLERYVPIQLTRKLWKEHTADRLLEARGGERKLAGLPVVCCWCCCCWCCCCSAGAGSSAAAAAAGAGWSAAAAAAAALGMLLPLLLPPLGGLLLLLVLLLLLLPLLPLLRWALQMLGVLQLLGGPAHRAQGGVEPRGGGVHKIDLINYLRFLRCVHPVT